MKQKQFIFLINLCSIISVFSQKEDKRFFVNHIIEKKSVTFSSEKNFKKACLFFIESKWDSTLVYSMRQLREERNLREINDFSHYLRLFSFKEKELYNEALKESGLISKKFELYNIVKATIGDIALQQNDYKKALSCFLEIDKLSDYINSKSPIYHNIGICYLHLKQFDRAEAYLSKSIVLQEKEKDTIRVIGTYMDIANLYYEQYQDAKAIPYFEKAYKLSKKTQNFELKQATALNMAVVEENRKNLPLSLIYRKEYETWKDSLNDQNKVWAIAELEKKYIVGQKQKEISLLEAKNKIRETQRNGLFYSSVLLLALFGTGIYFYRQKIKSNKIILSQKTALDGLNATKDRLFSIVSHDLRSSVNALKTSNNKLQESLNSKNYSELDKQLHNNSMIANGAYSLLDNLLHWAILQTKQDYFHQESHRLFMIVEQAVHSYVPLMHDKNIRFENKVKKEVMVFVDLDSIKIVLRNLLDNAIKFSKPDDAISIYLRNFDNQFHEVVVEDTGIGMSQEVIDELLRDTFSIAENKAGINAGTGLGMQLCKSLIQKNGGKLAIESAINVGTKIIVYLPVNA
ncbi:tetratricopeptide repeat-containing sensor histidine kinase [Flavobacterium sp.]|uniref:tetratricopeptide repeat-containing sensor histidine kinase n=1 Tax=Flavobacterium sp. TaxID=239 RepID=UPI00286B1588|nr:tetratricopeptide repeat-containing sensor histidine kinase [Flavobacterium sp.]